MKLNKAVIGLIFLSAVLGCSSRAVKNSRETAAVTTSEIMRCGVRSGTGGEAFLVNDTKYANEVMTLATQGGDQSLLVQLDQLLQNGSQVGQRYCVKVEVDDGIPKSIIEAHKVKEICGYRYGTGGEASLVESLGSPNVVLSLASQGAEQKLLEQLDSKLPRGSQVGTRYCVDGRLDNRNTVIEILGAREF